MRLIAVGCEYSGVSTLLNGLMEWGHAHGIHHHLDDHFAIPDKQFLRPEDARAMVALTPDGLLQEFLDRSIPFLNARDAVTRLMAR